MLMLRNRLKHNLWFYKFHHFFFWWEYVNIYELMYKWPKITVYETVLPGKTWQTQLDNKIYSISEASIERWVK